MATEEQEHDDEVLDAHLQDATRLTEEGRWDEAFELLSSLEADHPGSATLLCMLGVVASEMDARPVAYDFFRRALDAQPLDPHVLVTLGTALARYDDPDAEGALRLAAVTAPDVASTRLHYGAYLAREGLFEMAISELHAALAIEPDNVRAVRELAAAYLLSGDREHGADLLEQAAGLDPDDAEARLLLGLCLLGLDRLPEAAEELLRVGAEIEDDAEAQVAVALACATQGWLDEAWTALARAEGAPNPPDPDLVQEVEEALEADEAAAITLLQEEIAPPLLRERLLERP